jgi:hypothetical protein
MNRPMVNVPEGENETNVYRPMNDEEYAVWKADVKAYEEAPEVKHPLIEQVVSMSEEDKAALKEALGVS